MADISGEKRTSWLGLVVRFIVNAIVLLLISYIVPGFVISGFTSALIAAVVIAVLDYLIGRVFGIDASPFGRGITGFIVAAIILYLTQFLIPGVAVSFWGAIIGAFIIGIVDLILPSKLF